MSKDQYSIHLKVMAVNICRILMGAVLVFSGTVKIIDPRGTEYKIQDYAAALGFSNDLPTYMPLALGVALALLEFSLGIYLMFGIRRKWTSRIVLLMMLLFTPWSLYLAITNPVHDCGCFGDAIQLTNWQTFGKNIVLLTVALILWKWHHLGKRLISQHSQWLVALYSWLFGFLLAGYTIYTLPIIDFRPYHIGADLAEQMVWKEDGTVPPISDLMILDTETGQDLTDSIIATPGWKFLLIAPRLEVADDGVMDRLAELTDYCKRNHYLLICLTGSDHDGIMNWCDITGAEYPFCQADETALKTAIRSNPGLILLNGSIIEGKWASSQLPGYKELNAPVEELKWAHQKQETMRQHVIALFSLYVIPLLLLTLLDFIWSLYRKNKNTIHKPLKTNKMRKHIVAGNWKMNKNLQEGVALATELKEMLAAEKPNCDVIIGTPFIHLATVSDLLKDSVIAVSAENCANKASGAYTGEVSAEMVKSTGAEYVILGHSERREYYNETPEILKEKVDLALANGLKVIFCIGESLEQREANEQEAVCKAELAGSVFHLTAEQWKNIVIAYEPIWAIGTGKTATAEQAEEIHAYIRSCVADVYGKEVADETSILYGGSCKGSNAPELFGKEDIDGGLIGGASLKAADFKAIIDAWK